MKTIPLTQGKVAIVDDTDYEYLMQWDWYFHAKKYAARSIRPESGPATVLMHREVAERKGIESKYVDHIDLNRLNNRRGNLRAATNSQNMANRGPTKRNTSGFKGVFRDKSKHKWLASIRVAGHQIHLKRFDDKIDAAKAYNAAAVELFGEFAHLNPV
jgi:hypothetical protein